jgi:hypothetical protein
MMNGVIQNIFWGEKPDNGNRAKNELIIFNQLFFVFVQN